MPNCPVCCAEINEKAIKCPHCLSFIKPKINEGQFWGTGLMITGILMGLLCYIQFLSKLENIWIQMMNVGIFLAYLGFLVYGFGTFQSWFHTRKTQETDSSASTDKKTCLYCGELIDARAIKCNICYSFLRQEKGKVVAAFIIVSGILILTTAYVFYLARNIQSEFYMELGMWMIVIGILAFLMVAIKRRYTTPYL
jgi:hypothetical protein